MVITVPSVEPMPLRTWQLWQLNMVPSTSMSFWTKARIGSPDDRIPSTVHLLAEAERLGWRQPGHALVLIGTPSLRPLPQSVAASRKPTTDDEDISSPHLYSPDARRNSANRSALPAKPSIRTQLAVLGGTDKRQRSMGHLVGHVGN